MDHIIEYCQGGDWKLKNLRAAHRICNMARPAQPGGHYGNRTAAERLSGGSAQYESNAVVHQTLATVEPSETTP
jgi:5-methylcytosine-specific restriction endonuclease McrA